MKTEPFEELYKGYTLRCRPHRTPDDKFLAHVVIYRSIDGIDTEGTITPKLPPFNDERPAADAGLRAGMKWVDDHG